MTDAARAALAQALQETQHSRFQMRLEEGNDAAAGVLRPNRMSESRFHHFVTIRPKNRNCGMTDYASYFGTLAYERFDSWPIITNRSSMSRERYIAELDQTRSSLLDMGTLAGRALAEALEALAKSDRTAIDRVRNLEAEIEAFNKAIYERCLSLMTLQAPVAGDARLITGILEAIVDLELIGDYADEIAELALGMNSRPVSAALNELSEAAKRIQDMLSQALDSWRGLDRNLALSIRPMQNHAKNDCERLVDKLTTLSATSRDTSSYVGLILICKYLERIARHSVNIAEQAAFAAPSYS
ncbi:MAG TPA: phosphate signaling complex protein PhoU [Bryobacteraceae bacterium]|nr:phosphate signaling complex protein PhoU [Bryobacteraceae bacterium]